MPRTNEPLERHSGPARDGICGERSLWVAFASAVIALLASFATVGSTIPLFNIYRAQDGFNSADISLTVVAYSVGTLGTLLAVGRVSNYAGRRPVSIASLAFLIAGTLTLLNVHHIGILIAGRLLMGLGAGLASSSLTSYVVDAAPARPAWLASVASSQTVMLGLAAGAVVSGALVQFGPWPRDLVYVVDIGFLLLAAVMIILSPETVPRTSVRWRLLRPSVRLPIGVRQLLPVAAAVFLATWATGAFYQALVPALVQDQLGTNSPLVLGLVFAAYMGSSALGAPIGGWFTAAGAQRIGMAGFLIGWTGLVMAVATGVLPVFLMATVLAGASQAVAISAATRALLHGATPADRAPILAVVYLISYSGATIPSLISAQLSGAFSLPQLTLGYSGLALLATLFTARFARNPRTPAISESRVGQAGRASEGDSR